MQDIIYEDSSSDTSDSAHSFNQINSKSYISSKEWVLIILIRDAPNTGYRVVSGYSDNPKARNQISFVANTGYQAIFFLQVFKT